MISKWKNLELLKLGVPYSTNMEKKPKILEEISLHCKNFCNLEIDAGADIGREAASAIVTFLPNIKYLHIRNGRIDRKNLETIMQGCKELVQLDVRGSLWFESDDQLLKLASHITNFQYFMSNIAWMTQMVLTKAAFVLAEKDFRKSFYTSLCVW